MNNRLRRTGRFKTQKSEMGSSNLTKPFQSSIATILIQKCEKCTNQLQKDNLKSAKQIITSIDRDLLLLHPSHPDYARLMSLIYNNKAGYHRKNGQNQQALKWIDEAIAVERGSNIDRIDMARTLLNKSVIMGQMAREDKNLYSHQAAIALANQAIQIIKGRPEGKEFVNKDQYKLGEILIISFHNIATQFICLKNEKEGYNLYKKAYALSLRVLGNRHNLTIHLKNILNRHKQQRKQSRRAITQQSQLSPNKSKIIISSTVYKNTKKKNFITQNKKFKNFFRIYGYSKDTSFNESNKLEESNLEMKDLDKIQKIYKPQNMNTLFPEVKRKNIRDVISEGRDLASRRQHVASVGERQISSDKQKLKSSKFGSSKISSKTSKNKLQKLKSQQIVLPSQAQKLMNSKLGKQKKEEIQLKKIEQPKQTQQKPKQKQGGQQIIGNKQQVQSGCQLI